MKTKATSMTPDNLISIRKELNLSRKELALKLGLSYSQVQSLELGRRAIAGPTLLALECLLRKDDKSLLETMFKNG